MMRVVLPAFVGLLLAAVSGPVAAIDVTSNPELVAELKNAATNLDRMNLLPNDADWLFDFTVCSEQCIL